MFKVIEKWQVTIDVTGAGTLTWEKLVCCELQMLEARSGGRAIFVKIISISYPALDPWGVS